MGLPPTGLWPCRLLPVPVPCIGTLTLMGSSHLSFSLTIRTTGSHVPHKSQNQVHATCMPDATQTVNRFPLDLSWSSERPPVLTSFFRFRHLISSSLALVSLNLTWHNLCHAFSLMLTTLAFDQSSLRWFGTYSCKSVPRGLPSSPVQPRGALSEEIILDNAFNSLSNHFPLPAS